LKNDKKSEFDCIVYHEFLHLSVVSSRQAKTFITFQRKFQREMLNVHNSYRSRYCTRSFRLDDNLSRSAQNYTQQLANMIQWFIVI